MSRILFLCLLLFITACGTQGDQHKSFKVFLLAGQSNMDGCGKSEKLPGQYKKPPSNVKVWDNKLKKWVTLGQTSFAKRRRFQFGPEIAFAHRLSHAYPHHQIRLIKTSAGGTALYSQWLPGKGMHRYFTNNIKNALSDLAVNQKNFDVEGMLWMQGESDAARVDTAKNYGKNFEVFVKDIRHRVNKPSLPIVMGRVSSEILKATKWNFKQARHVQACQEQAATKDPHIHIINTDAFGLLNDHTHFNTQGELQLGNAMADIILKVIRQKSD